MRKAIYLTSLAVMVMVFSSCGSTRNAQQDMDNLSEHNSRNSLDWAGVYAGILHCADCEGIETMIRLNSDNTYELEWKYLGKRVATVEKKGKFAWDAMGGTIILDGVEVIPSMYKVGENWLAEVGKDGKLASDTRKLQKHPSEIVEKYWKLIEVNGKAVMPNDKWTREPHMILKAHNNRAGGNGGCNSFGGTYQLQEGSRISFSKLTSTLMACENMEVESAFYKALEMADNYTLTTTGDTLSLNKARMAPLARFAAVYLR